LFHPHLEQNAFVGLDADDEFVTTGMLLMALEQHQRGWLEMNHDFCHRDRHAFPCPDVKRYATPSPIINVKLNGNVGFRHGVRIHPFSSRYPGKVFP
jgi:hypothetical protein